MQSSLLCTSVSNLPQGSNGSPGVKDSQKVIISSHTVITWCSFIEWLEFGSEKSLLVRSSPTEFLKERAYFEEKKSKIKDLNLKEQILCCQCP